jgi:pSer/pThr/pTyr-binding forkhead associated (FHA) protein
MRSRLLARSDSMTSQEFILAETTRIGSGADADVCLEAAGVLALHATIQREGDRVWLVDQAGAAGRGTWLNGRRVSREWLQTLDVISIGSVDLVYLDA